MPVEGGCWWCWSDPAGSEEFSMEWDTFYHKECLERILIADPENKEAKIMFAESQQENPA